MWQVSVRTTWDGVYVDRIHPTSARWSSNLVGTGEASFVFHIGDANQPLPREPHELFQPNARSIDLRWGDYVAFYGKIQDWEHDEETDTITVRVVELANEFKWRMTYGVANYPDGTLVIPGRTESGAVARILERFMYWDVSWRYPIDLPADAPGTVSETWEFWRKYRISDLIEQMRERGVEVYLRPYAAADGTTRLQTRVAKRVTLGTSAFHLLAAEKPISKVRYRVDGSKQLTGVQGLGNGSGEDQETRYAWAMPGESIPFRDAKLEFSDLTGDALQAATTTALAEDRNAVVQWTVGEFRIDENWGPEHAAVGRVWEIDATGHRVIPNRVHSLRVVRASGTLGTTIKTEVQSAA